MIALALAFAMATQETVENPEYKWWAAFREGSSVSRIVEIDGKVQEGKTRTTLKSIGKDAVVLEETNGVQALGSAQTRREIPAKIPAATFVKPDKEGDEVVEAGGKKIKCHWSELQKPTAGGKTEIVRYWLNNDVPGKVVRIRVTQPGGLTTLLTAVEWEKK